MKESTRKIVRMHGLRFDRAVHNYIYFVFYDKYVAWFLRAGRLVVKRLGRLKLAARAFQMVYNRYHAKVITMEDASKILTLNRDIAPGPDSTERIIPYPYANRIILQEPDYIAVMDCPCRLSRPDGCRPVNVCIAVGRTTAQFWLEHCEKYNARKIDREEALRIVREGRRRGNITTAWFKVATGGRTGVICSCCTCCCGGLEAMRLAAKLKHGQGVTNMIPSGYKVDHDPRKCDSCGECARACIFEAITLDDDGRPVYDSKLCMGCGLCVEKCPEGARSYNRDFNELHPLDLELAAGNVTN